MTVTVESADVALEEAVRTLLSKHHGRLAAIFHLAGVLHNAPVGRIQWHGGFERVLAAKARGARLLDRCSRELVPRLRHFVLFSSVFALLGFGQLAHYSAANVYLDALAQARRTDGPRTGVGRGQRGGRWVARSLCVRLTRRPSLHFSAPRCLLRRLQASTRCL